MGLLFKPETENMELKYEFYMGAGLEEVWNAFVWPEGTRKTFFGCVMKKTNNTKETNELLKDEISVQKQGNSFVLIGIGGTVGRLRTSWWMWILGL